MQFLFSYIRDIMAGLGRDVSGGACMESLVDLLMHTVLPTPGLNTVQIITQYGSIDVLHSTGHFVLQNTISAYQGV